MLGYYAYALLGWGTLNVPYHDQLVYLQYPHTNVYYEYSHQHQHPNVIGGGLGLTRPLSDPDYDLDVSIGLSGYHMESVELKGLASPLWYWSHDFERLGFKHHAQSNLFFIETRLDWQHPIKWGLHPYGLIGLGGGCNHFYAYQQKVSVPGPKAWIDYKDIQLSNYRELDFAFEVAVGLTLPLNAHCSLDLAYRYFNLGEFEAGLTPVHTTTERLTTDLLGVHTIALSVRLTS